MKKINKPLILCIICFLLSFAITLQVRLTNKSESNASREKISSDLKDKIFELSNDNEKLVKKLETVEKRLEVVRSGAAENDTSNKEKSELIKKYNAIEGKSDEKGPGIIIRYYPNENKVNGETVGNADITKDLLDIVNELRNAGAEAIAINNIRITNTSAIEMVKNDIVVDEVKISKPFTIETIGNAEIMNSSLIRPGGTIELIKRDRAKIELAISKEVNIPRTTKM